MTNGGEMANDEGQVLSFVSPLDWLLPAGTLRERQYYVVFPQEIFCLLPLAQLLAILEQRLDCDR